jgi:putative restriction endonuclease
MPIGELPNAAPGLTFASRRELYDAGVHRALQAGIVGSASSGAESIVLSGGYVDDQDLGTEIIYTGDGGRDSASGRQIADQVFEGHNQALVTSCLQGLLVRVVRGAENKSPYSPTKGFRYEGLYRVEDYWHEHGVDGFKICRYRLLSDQPPSTSGQTQTGPAPKVQSTILRIVRDTAVSRKVKALHNFHCQICGTRLECEGGPYAEGAHIRPLGTPHNGPDVLENVLCLCPNDHVLFDHGAISIADDFQLMGKSGCLRIAKKHEIDPAHLKYHREMWGLA